MNRHHFQLAKPVLRRSHLLNRQPPAAGIETCRETSSPLPFDSQGNETPRPAPGFAASFTALLLLMPGLAGAVETNTVLTEWLAAQTNLTTWSADLIQTRWLKALNQPLVSTGHVWFAKPDHFRWELGKPAQTIAVRNNEQLQVIYPRLKRVERYPLAVGKSGPLGEALNLLNAGFPEDSTSFDARFRLVSLQNTSNTWLIGLQPVSPTARRMMPVIRVTLAQDSFLLLANELEFPDGSRMRSEFINGVTNSKFPADLFKPVTEAGYTIIDPLSR